MCHRLVPLQNGNALFAADYSQADWTRHVTDYNTEHKKLVTETEDLRAHTLAFVLGLRGSTKGTSASVLGDGPNLPVYNGHNVGMQPALMPGMVGTERFQQLCSIEYLHAYFHNVLAGKTIALTGKTIADIVTSDLSIEDKTTGPLGEVRARKKPDPNNAGQMVPAVNLANSTLTDAKDLAQLVVERTAEVASEPKQMQGIFTRDKGPFLIGKGGATRLVHGTEKNLPTSTNQPFAVSRNLGDDVAFSVLDSLMAAQGLTDWRPDGIVLSKGVNDPSDKMSDEMLEARDGQLYNLRVQGPAIGTTWTGERSMETLPMDKVFVVLIADVWFNPEADGFKYALPGAVKTAADREEYKKERLFALNQGLNATSFAAAQSSTWADGTTETPVLCNFRLEASTSAEMINYSEYRARKVGATQYGSKKRKLDVGPRMNLKLCDKFGEYIVGGWQIGNVMDTSASRAAMPQGSNIGVRTAPNTSALNINVNIGWWSADRLARAFNNPDGTVTPRYVKTKKLATSTPAINQQLTKEEFDGATRVAGLTRSASTVGGGGAAPAFERSNTIGRPGGSDDVSGVQVGA